MKLRTQSSRNSRDPQIGLEAARWLMRLQDSEFDPQDAQDGARSRDARFLQWLATSPRHVQIFLETFQTSRLMDELDPRHSIRIQELLEGRGADVIAFHGAAPAAAPPDASDIGIAEPRSRFGGGRALGLSAAALFVLAAGAWLAWRPGVAQYSTTIGEQRTCKLEDGSFVYLNTDSRVEVSFSERERRVRLVAGEALFVIERDSRRPFVVDAGDAAINVLGTRFNVRRRDTLTDIAVVEGVVQVIPAHAATGGKGARLPDHPADATASSEGLQLLAGQEARISGGKVARRASANVENALAWRARRLVFTESPLPEVVMEFNRYNRRQMRVEGDIARAKKLTGIFDADRPNALIMYAMNDEALVVEPDGDNWVIRAR